jgi:hypothetical protein
MKNFPLSMGEQRKQNALVPHRKPLRTLKEMAVEFGVTKQTLVGYISHHDGPRPVFATGYFANSNSKRRWYDPDKMREWWAGIQATVERNRAVAKARRRVPADKIEPTRAFLAQQWLREHGPATQRQLMEAGFINMTASTLLKMIGFGAVLKDKRDGRVIYTATDKDYVRQPGRSHYTREDTPNETT